MNITQARNFVEDFSNQYVKIHQIPANLKDLESEEVSEFMSNARPKIEELKKNICTEVEAENGRMINKNVVFNIFSAGGFSRDERVVKIFWVEEYENSEFGQIFCVYTRMTYSSKLAVVTPDYVFVVADVGGKPQVISSYGIRIPSLPIREGSGKFRKKNLELEHLTLTLNGGIHFNDGFGELKEKEIYIEPESENFEYLLQCYEHFDRVSNWTLENDLNEFKGVKLPKSYDDLTAFIRKEFLSPAATVLSKFDPGPSSFFYKIMEDESTPDTTRYMLLHIIRNLLVNDKDKAVKKESKSFFQWGSATHDFEGDLLKNA